MNTQNPSVEAKKVVGLIVKAPPAGERPFVLVPKKPIEFKLIIVGDAHQVYKVSKEQWRLSWRLY